MNMDFFWFLLKVEKGLCRLLGLSSPWSAPVKATVVYILYIWFLYIVPLSSILLINAGIEYPENREYYVLSVFTYFVFTVEIYATICTYHFRNRNIGEFVGEYFKVHTCLETTVNTNDRSEMNKNIFKLSSLFLMNVTKLSVLIFKLVYTFHYNFHLLTCMHCVVAMTMSLQWALSMHNLDTQFAKLKGLMKNMLKSSSCTILTATNDDPASVNKENNSCSDNSSSMGAICFEKVDAVINVTRTLAEKYRLVNQYYGVHMGYYVSGLVYQVVKHAYGIWYCVAYRHLCDDVSNFIRSMTAICNLVTIIILATISDSANKKVSNKDVLLLIGQFRPCFPA